MLVDSIQFLNPGNFIDDLSVETGAALPESASVGQLFLKTGTEEGLYYYKDTWQKVSSGGGGGVGSLVGFSNFSALRSSNGTFTGYASRGLTGSEFNSGAFNAATGVFTTPSAGLYQFNYLLKKNSNTTGRTILQLRLNGTVLDELAEAYNPYQDVGGAVTLYLPANTQISLALDNLDAGGSAVAWFSGFLFLGISSSGKQTYPHPENKIYVSTTGNDTTANGSVSLPFATIQAALYYLEKFAWTTEPIIQIQDGTYNVTGSILLPFIKYENGMQVTVYVQGNASNKNAVVINSTSCVFFSGNFGKTFIRNLKCTGADGAIGADSGVVWISNVSLGTTNANWWTGFVVRSYDRGVIYLAGGGVIDLTSNCYAFLVGYRQGCIQCHGAPGTVTVNFPSAVTANAFAFANVKGLIEVPGLGFTNAGNFSGLKARADWNSFIGLWGTVLPGSSNSSANASHIAT